MTNEIKKEVEKQLREQKAELQLAIADATRQGNEEKVKSLQKKKNMTSPEIEAIMTGAITCSTNIYGVHTMH